MNVLDFRDLIIRPTLDELAKAEPRIRSKAAVALLLGTALCESELTFLRQRVRSGFGLALSFFQIEPATHKDVKRYLNERRRDLATRVFGLSTIIDPDDFELATNLRYATAISRVKYWMIPAKLPLADDYLGLSQYHKNYYNTALGKADIEKTKEVFRAAVEGSVDR
ncbi:hypothetical protein LCGC14_2126330 [marine sediment metagenome]|uniref:Uncharacterized protein n=1 Tax=marine sediment metagenome TaxID=412755 RepID=A0A0F9E2T9_9ZZZZ